VPRGDESSAASVGRPRATAITLLVESAWMPVTLVDTGPVLLRSTQIEALVRHRFGLHHSGALDPVADWDLRITHRAGDRNAVAYAVAPIVKRTLVDAAKELGLKIDAMLPASAWGWDRLLRGKVCPPPRGWWIWPEQDRTLVARIAADQIVALNAGASRFVDPSSALNLVRVEAVRLGIEAMDEPIMMATWDDFGDERAKVERVTSMSIRGDTVERHVRKVSTSKVLA
jgi:hypothetical protein